MPASDDDHVTRGGQFEHPLHETVQRVCRDKVDYTKKLDTFTFNTQALGATLATSPNNRGLFLIRSFGFASRSAVTQRQRRLSMYGSGSGHLACRARRIRLDCREQRRCRLYVLVSG